MPLGSEVAIHLQNSPVSHLQARAVRAGGAPDIR
jgi:hypothetical protein